MSVYNFDEDDMDELNTNPYKKLLTHLANISGKTISELLHIQPEKMPTEWFKEIFRQHLDDTLTGPEWNLARINAKLPFPPVSYGTVTDQPIHEKLEQLIPEVNVHNKEWILSHVRDKYSICQDVIDDYTISYALLKANAVVYAYYHDEERHKDIVIGMIYLFYNDSEKRILLPVVCADGSFPKTGTTLLILVKHIVIIHEEPYNAITLQPVSEAVHFYRNRGFVWERNRRDMEWKPTYRDIAVFLKQYHGFEAVIRKKWVILYREYVQDRERQYRMKQIEESE